MTTVILSLEARDQLGKLPRAIAFRVEALIARLSHWPDVSGVKHLRGGLKGKCRLRTGDYRLQFHVEVTKRAAGEKKRVEKKEVTAEPETIEYLVMVEKIGHRDG